jgi:hypothetical protein
MLWLVFYRILKPALATDMNGPGIEVDSWEELRTLAGESGRLMHEGRTWDLG